METVLESDSEEQGRGGETQEEEEEEELAETLRNASAPQKLLSLNPEADRLCPESYRVNSPDETRLLAIADSFQRQYSHLCPDRKPLLLCPANECGVKKFVSTALWPTPPQHPELYSWQGCASFVADFLSLEPLEPPVEPPRSQFSSSSVLRSQRATCLEFASLLCSLLLGAHYDAYCVSGYAVREMCVLDQSLQDCPPQGRPLQDCPPQDCPLLDAEVKDSARAISEAEPQQNQYTVKPQRELKSRFLTQQEKKKLDAEAAALQEQTSQEEVEQRPADPLRGLRVHCWVLVLSGNRSVRENFFIDPLTGNGYATDDDHFLGIESVWNNLNYYVNMQDCSGGCAGMVYDLEDLQMWEPVLFGATSKKQLILKVLKRKESQVIDKISSDQEVQEPLRVFEMPRSWISDITISKKDLERRWPGGTKVTRYRKAKLEKFAPYLRPDGLVTRLTTYKDQDCAEVGSVKEWFQHRSDQLKEREADKVDNVTVERFGPGQRFHLLVRRFTDAEHEMEFSSARLDYLVRRVQSPGEMTETFEGRLDRLHYRRVVFERHIQLSDPNLIPEIQPLEKVVERFHRNRSKPASEDVAERVFLLAERRMEVTYQFEDCRYIPSKRSFIKPRELTEKQKAEDFTADMVSSFQVDLSVRPLKTLTLYEMLLDLMKDEEEAVEQIRVSVREVRDIVTCREQEDTDVQLLASRWTTVGTARARSQRQEMERLAEERWRWLQEKDRDVLAPFLIRLGHADTLSAEDAEQLYHDCLAEFKQRLAERGELIRRRYEKETKELQEKRQWYQQNQHSLTKEQEDEYRAECCEKTLRIRVAQKRLDTHEEAAPRKYGLLQEKLRKDPRLTPHLPL